MHRFVLALLLVFLVFTSTASAADATANQSASIASPQKLACGATVADALKQAQILLAMPGAQSERAALACLIEATATIEAEKLTFTRDPNINVLAVPKSTGVNIQ